MDDMESVARLSRDVMKAAVDLKDAEVRFLVDAYYAFQDDRKRAANQVRALSESGEPHAVLTWLEKQSATLEAQLKRALDSYTSVHPMGKWLRDIYGIGPVLAAGLLAHIDMEPFRCVHVYEPAGDRPPNPYYDPQAEACHEAEPHGPECRHMRLQTVGSIWRFAGLDPTSHWEKGQRRPWNAALKVLCWKCGQSFMKFSNESDCYYGQVYKSRKAFEVERNERGDNAEQAARILTERNFSKATEAYKHLSSGKLPPAQIDARARRVAVKLFLSHLWETWYRQKYNKAPPRPYAIERLGHGHYLEPPPFQRAA